MKSFCRDPDVDYEILLRTIGQRLEDEQVDSFALEITERKVFVYGGSGFPRSKSLEPGHKSNTKRTTANRVNANYLIPGVGRSQTSSRIFRDCFPIEDLYQLDQQGRAKRKDQDRIPNGQSISQVLRAMGAYISRRDARLSSVAVRDGMIEIVYETAEGKQALDVFRWPR